MTRRSRRASARKPAARVVVRSGSSDPNEALRAALARESDRILHSSAIKKALDKRVRFEVEHETDAPIDRMRPAFALDLYAEWDDNIARARAKLDASLPTRLDALATVLAHSFRLNAFPKLKRAFWIHILDSEMMLLDEEDFFQAKNWYWMIDDPRFPAFSLDVPSDSSTDTIFDAITHFFTTLPQHKIDAQLVRQHSALFAPLTVNVGLKFPRSALKLDRLQSLERTLDSVFASPMRQFGIDVLDLSQHRFGLEQLAVVTSVLTKNHTVYKIEDVRLRNVTDVQLATQPAKLAPVLDAMLDVVTAACNTSLVHSPSLRTASASALKKLQLDLNQQTARHVAALCSALRYSSSLEVLAIGGGLTKLDAREQELCWRWLAFGVFYPRSKKLAAGNAFHALDLAHVRLNAGDLPAFLSALADPVRGLVHHETVKSAATKSTDAELLLCTIKTGAQFYATADAVKTDVLHVLESECELEALVQENGWTCVVLPGIGLGWVESAQIVRLEREAVDVSAHTALAHSDSSGIALSLRHIEIPDTAAGLAAFHAFIERVGPQLRALNLNCGLVRGVDCNATMPVILRHCVHLQHLDMSNNSLRNSAITTLVRAFESGHGTQLLSLNLDYNDFTHRGVDTLARYLSNRTKIPALRELRLVGCTMQARSFKSIYRALRANKTLQFINLTGPFYDYGGGGDGADGDSDSDDDDDKEDEEEWEDIGDDDDDEEEEQAIVRAERLDAQEALDRAEVQAQRDDNDDMDEDMGDDDDMDDDDMGDGGLGDAFVDALESVEGAGVPGTAEDIAARIRHILRLGNVDAERDRTAATDGADDDDGAAPNAERGSAFELIRALVGGGVDDNGTEGLDEDGRINRVAALLAGDLPLDDGGDDLMAAPLVPVELPMPVPAAAPVVPAIAVRARLRIAATVRDPEDYESDDDDLNDRDDYQAADAERKRIEKRFQGKWVCAKLPLPHKLAFLSVLRGRTLPGAATTSSQNLDSFMAASVIRFAGERVKRHILWEDLR